MARKSYSTVDEYLADFSGETRTRMDTIRNLFLKADTRVTERISYNIPAYFIDGKMVGYFAVYDNHVSLYPAVTTNQTFNETAKELLSGKSTLKFPHSKSLPLELIDTFITIKCKEIDSSLTSR